MKVDRILGILAMLLQHDRVTAPQLAEKFEVSRRTINRDIETLCMAGIPIVAYQGHGGGFSIASGYSLDKTLMSERDREAIWVGLQGLESISQEGRLEGLMDMLNPKGMLRQSIEIDLAANYKRSLTEKIGLLQSCIADNRRAVFTYYHAGGTSQRDVEPYRIFYRWRDWYMLGYCRNRQDFRTFKLNRMWELQQGDSFTPQPDRRPVDDLPYADTQRLEALFWPQERYRIIESYGPHSYQEAEDGRLRLEIGFANDEFIIGWLLGFGERVEVIAPASIREEMRRISTAMAELYRLHP